MRAAALALAVALLPLAAAQGNFVPQGDFELGTGADGAPAGWFGRWIGMRITDEDAWTGSHALRVEREPVADESVLQSQPKMTVQPGACYRIGAAMKPTSGDGGEVTITLLFLNERGGIAGGDGVVGPRAGTADWARVESVVEAPFDAARGHVEIGIREGVAAHALVDDVQFGPERCPVEAPPAREPDAGGETPAAPAGGTEPRPPHAPTGPPSKWGLAVIGGAGIAVLALAAAGRRGGR